MTNYRRGADKERRVMNQWRDQGCIAFRSAGSHSPIDVCVINEKQKEIILIQCKPASAVLKSGGLDAAHMRIAEELKKLEGTYTVKTEVAITQKWKKE